MGLVWNQEVKSLEELTSPEGYIQSCQVMASIYKLHLDKTGAQPSASQKNTILACGHGKSFMGYSLLRLSIVLFKININNANQTEMLMYAQDIITAIFPIDSVASNKYPFTLSNLLRIKTVMTY